MRALAALIAVGFVFPVLSLAAATFADLAAQATAARQANDVPHSIELYRQALQLQPAWPEGWWFLGTLFYDSDQYANGQEAFSHFVKLDERAAPGWSFLGLCEFETGQYALALEHIRHGLDLGAGNQAETEEVLRFHEALLLTRLGLFDQSLGQYVPLARSGSKDPTLIAGIGLASLRRPLLPKEIPASQKDVILLAGKVAYDWMTGEMNNAEAGFRVLLAGFANEPQFHYFYGTFLLVSRPGEALAEFKHELSVNPQSADARAMIALTFVRDGDEIAALPYAKKAAEDSPSTPMGRYIYGLILCHSGDSHGVEHLEAAERLDPRNLEYHIALAGAYSKFGRPEDARRERLASISLAKESDPRGQK